ncbi:NusG domain II-containing protein [Candidatus Formimonas warabiya]|uniref:Uncharacterized protein n=1 Tax=Formimonas warabiya TaxID=1761012 RepID=A0A3G1KTX5_FORW1|nr:NusG domain II-containing protein [Candidatus Formimonas warabiya]ATW25896.1 hypothetical protein DCMF_14945 [Candidatus Formimonas warabiya]
MTKRDKGLVGGIALIALLSFLFTSGLFKQDSSGTAVIKVGGKAIEEVNLIKEQGERQFIVQGVIGPTTVKIKDHQISIVTAPCRDKICVHRGWIKNHGEAIVCVPNQVVIEMKGKRANLDDITR